MTNKTTVLLSVTTVVLMITCCFSVAVYNFVSDGDVSGAEDGRETYRYVSLGDSMTNGYGFFGYYADEQNTNYIGFMTEVSGTYPSYLADYLRENLTDKSVDFDPMAISGSRTTEIRALLYDDFDGDVYTTSYWTGMDKVYEKAAMEFPELAGKYQGFELLQNVYRAQLASADLITLQYYSDFIFDLYLGDAVDFSLYLDKDFVDSIKEIKSEIFAYLTDLFKGMGADISSVLSVIDTYSSDLAYAVVSYCSNVDAICDWIYSNNVDAKVVILNTCNPVDGISMSMDGYDIDLGSIIGFVIDLANKYSNCLSAYSFKNYHVVFDSDPVLIYNEFQDYEAGSRITDAAMASAICSLGLADLPAQTASLDVYKKLDSSNGNLSVFLKYIFSSTSSSVKGVDVIGDEELEDKLKVVVGYRDDEGVITYGILADEGTTVSIDDDYTVTVSNADGSVVKTFVKSELATEMWTMIMGSSGVMAHTSTIGHAYEWKELRETVESEHILSDSEYVDDSEYVADCLTDIVLSLKKVISGISGIGVGDFNGLADVLADMIDRMFKAVGTCESVYRA